MKQEKLVSIGVPTYNGASKHLAESLESVLGQTYRNLEVIISDNASTDGTELLCRGIAAKDSRVRYIRQQKNIGPVANFNFVLGAAHGDYFMWHADDDLRNKTFVDKCIAEFMREPRHALVFSRFTRFDDKTHERIEYDPKGYLPLERVPYERLKHHILLPWSDGKAVPIYGLYDRRKIGSDRLENYIGLGFDMNFIFRMLGRGSAGLVNETLFMKRADLDHPQTFRFGMPHRILASFLYRLRRVISPYFASQVRFVAGARELPLVARLTLIGWVLFTVIRLFVRRKM